MSARTQNNIIEIIAALLILLFVYTAVSKWMDYASFKEVIGRSPLIAGTDKVLARGLPLIELLIAVLLFIPALRTWGMLASLLLMTVFTLYIGYMMVFSTHLPCSCGGVLKQMTWPQHLLFNIFFTAIALIGYVLVNHNKFFIAINRQSRTPV